LLIPLVSSISVALCRAMLMKVDLLLLDEPTNHLDVQSVEWLQNCAF
jgi:elongation factor 3